MVFFISTLLLCSVWLVSLKKMNFFYHPVFGGQIGLVEANDRFVEGVEGVSRAVIGMTWLEDEISSGARRDFHTWYWLLQ